MKEDKNHLSNGTLRLFVIQKTPVAPSVHESECQSLGVVYAQGFLALFSWPSFVEP